MFNEKQIEVLNQELESSRIKSRLKGNISLSYLEGFDILETANRVFGFGNWSYKITDITSVSSEVNQNQNHVICYKVTVQIVVQNEDHTKDISREDVGFGTGIAKTLADANEGGAKEAVTDAIKRTLRSFGNQFGNSLYSKDKNHSNNANHNQNYQQSANNDHTQQQQSHTPNNNNQTYQQPYQHQQDFSQLTDIGLTVMQQGQNLVVVGENVFENKEMIKQNGFRWDGQSKSWYIPLNQAA